MSIYNILPDHEALLALEPEELAGVVLQYLNTLPENAGHLNRYNFGLPDVVERYPEQHKDDISKALMEAWMWLEREGLIAPKPRSREWVFVTRRGKQITKAMDLKSYRNSAILPKQFLHPVLAQKVWSAFIRGEYETAVFQAFKEVEVTVRSVGNFSPMDLGVDLMRKAFKASEPLGPLTDTKLPVPEQEALAHLFAGAIGSYKNPHSHRKVEIGPEEAAEMIILASHLLRIIDSKNST